MKNSAGSIGSFDEDNIWRSITFNQGEIDSTPVVNELDSLPPDAQQYLLGAMTEIFGLQGFIIDSLLDTVIESCCYDATK